jgi:hypothetical protein
VGSAAAGCRSIGRPHVGLKLPFVNYWNAYCKQLFASRSTPHDRASGRPSAGETMKIYMLMVLIGTIAAMSHVNVDRKSPRRGA